ncbi:MAG: hypothetical protein JNM93_05450 [Bacteriovoracaceae bacterium]|nr:hypothetical protein [Bacteriovoracaceae bacterium]
MLKVLLFSILLLPTAFGSNLYPEQLCDILMKSNVEIFKDLQKAQNDSRSALNELLSKNFATSPRLQEIQGFKSENSDHFLMVKKISKAEDIIKYFEKIESLATAQFNDKNFMGSNLNTKALYAQLGTSFILTMNAITFFDPEWYLPLASFSLLQFLAKYMPYYKNFNRTFLDSVKSLTGALKFTGKPLSQNNHLSTEAYKVNRNIFENFENNTVIELNKEFLASLDLTLKFSNLKKNTFDLKVDHFIFDSEQGPELYIAFEIDKSRL